MATILRTAEGLDEPTVYSWDSEWAPYNPETGTGGYADWAIVDPADDNENTRNAGGLKSQDGLATAVLIQLFTDRRRPDDMPVDDESLDKRGWHGDSYDIEKAAGEREIGSLLWTVKRERMTTIDMKRVEHYAYEALQPLIDQGAVDHFEIKAERDALDPNRVNMLVSAFDRKGAALFAGKYPLQ